jgi:hypothetical protein
MRKLFSRKPKRTKEEEGRLMMAAFQPFFDQEMAKHEQARAEQAEIDQVLAEYRAKREGS